MRSKKQVVKTATCHKAASLGLLADASEVMVKMEDIVYNAALSGNEREQLLRRVGHRLLLAMDRAEGVVRKYGHVNAMRKMFQSSEVARGQFEDAAEEIGKVSLVADAGNLLSMKMMMMSQEANMFPRDVSLAPTMTQDATNGVAMSPPEGYEGIEGAEGGLRCNESSGAIAMDGSPHHSVLLTSAPSGITPVSPRSPTWTQNTANDVHAAGVAGGVAGGVVGGIVGGVAGGIGAANVANATSATNATKNATDYGAPNMMSAPSSSNKTTNNANNAINDGAPAAMLHPAMSRAETATVQPGAVRTAPKTSAMLSKTDGIAVVTEFGSLELFKGSKQAFLEAGASVELESVEEDNGSELLGSFLWIYSSKILGPDRMTMINTFDASRQTIQNDRSTVTIMHYDDRGVLWTGHKGGQVTAWNVHTRKPYCKSVKVSSGQIKAITSDEAGTAWVGSDKGDVRRVTLAEQTMDAEVIGYELVVTGQLKHSGSGTPDISASHPLDANGMVINLRAKEKAHNGPVTAILAAAGRVWTSGGSPAFVCFKEWTQRGEFMNKRDLKVTGAATCMKLVSPFVAVRTRVKGDQFNATGTRKTSHAEVRQQYQVIMGYANGTIGVWGPMSGILSQIMRIGRHLPPVTGLAVLDELGLVATSHIDGRLRLRIPPRIVDKDRLSVAYTPDSVYSVNLNLIELVASKAGDSIMGVYAHKTGMSYATAAAKTTFVSNDTLAEIIVQAGAKLLRGLGNKLSSCSPEWASKSMEESYSDDVRGDQESFNQMKSSMLFPQDAFQWMIDYADLTQTRVIGEGAFGKVYLGKWHETDVAIKALTSLGALGISAGQIASYATESDVKEALKTLEREVGLMVGMRHPNVILFLGVCPDPPCVVTEYCARGSLYDVLVEAKERPKGGLARALSWYRRVSMMLDAAKGMLYLHSHKPTIIHRDLKSPNLLVDGNWNVKVTDFNLSRLADVTQPGVTSSVVANNPRWHAPEIIRDALFTKPGDVYAFGLIMWEMITWELPYDSMNSFQMILFVGDKGGRPPVPDPATGVISEGGSKEWVVRGGMFPAYEAYVDLMVRCWDQNPDSRPGFPEIISKLRDILTTFSESDAEAVPVIADQIDSEDSRAPSVAISERASGQFGSGPAFDSTEQLDTSKGLEDRKIEEKREDKKSGEEQAGPGPGLGVASTPPFVPAPSPFTAPDNPGGGNATIMRPPPNPFDVSIGPFSDVGESRDAVTASNLPSVAPTIWSPFDAANSGDISDFTSNIPSDTPEQTARRTSGDLRNGGDRPGGVSRGPVVDSVTEGHGGSMRRRAN